MYDPEETISKASSELNGHPPKEDFESMFCTQCGIRNPEDANFCQKCGKQMGRALRPLDDSLSTETNMAEFALLQQPEDRVGDLLASAFRRREKGDIEGAIRACATALQVMPESTSAHSLMGMLFEAQGERDKAISEFERVLALNPGSIADREKLEQLRDATTSITPRKITNAQTKRMSLFDSPAGAASAAVAVFLLVLAIGGWAVWTRDKSRAARTQTTTNSGPAPLLTNNPAQVVEQKPAAPTQQFNNGWPIGVNPNSQAAPPAPQQQFPQQQAALPQQQVPIPQPQAPAGPTTERLPTFQPGVGPARINLNPPRPLNPPELSAFPRISSDSTVHLPDNGLAKTELGPGPNSGQRAGPVEPPKTNPGKIEIIVSQDGGNSAAPGSPSTSQGSMDSRSRRAIAHQAQLEGDYRRAVREYLKSLDGAGDDAASIHQQIGICYQRLDDKDSASAHYKDAITEYKSQIAAGRNVEAAKSGISACERCLRAL